MYVKNVPLIKVGLFLFNYCYINSIYNCLRIIISLNIIYNKVFLMCMMKFGYF